MSRLTTPETIESSIALVVAVSAFTNYLNEVAQTAIDFPRVGKQRQAA